MTREQALEVLINRYNSGVIRGRVNDEEWRLATETAIAALRGLEWIRTVDRMPEDGERVLVTECGRVFVERFDRLLGFDTPTTHWMPLPEPPGVEVEG